MKEILPLGDLSCSAWNTCFVATRGEKGILLRSVENTDTFLRIDADQLILAMDNTGAEPETSWSLHELDYDLQPKDKTKEGNGSS